MTYEDERDQSEIRRRAAWLLGMLAVVAALLVVLMVFFLGSSGGGGQNDAAPGPTYPVGPTSAPPGSRASGAPSSDSSGSSTSGTPATSGASSGPVPTASCSSDSTCTVTGDLPGAVSAINELRAQHNLDPVQVSTSGAAETCALTSGDDCPQSFVWVHVDDLSGAAVVNGVQGFDGTDNLLDAGATSFALGWAYDPGSDSASCAVIRVR